MCGLPVERTFLNNILALAKFTFLSIWLSFPDNPIKSKAISFGNRIFFNLVLFVFPSFHEKITHLLPVIFASNKIGG